MIQSLLLVFVFEILTYKKSSLSFGSKNLVKIIENLFELKLIIWIPYITFRITFLGSHHMIGNNGYLKPSLSFLVIWKCEIKLIMLMRKIPPSFLNPPPNIRVGKCHGYEDDGKIGQLG